MKRNPDPNKHAIAYLELSIKARRAVAAAHLAKAALCRHIASEHDDSTTREALVAEDDAHRENGIAEMLQMALDLAVRKP